MEAWIKGMLQHQGMERVKEWDVINEPIADNNQWRGIDGNFMSNGDDAPARVDARKVWAVAVSFFSPNLKLSM